MKLMYLENSSGAQTDHRYILLHPSDDERGISFAMLGSSENEFRLAGRYTALSEQRSPSAYYPFHKLLLKDNYV